MFRLGMDSWAVYKPKPALVFVGANKYNLTALVFFSNLPGRGAYEFSLFGCRENLEEKENHPNTLSVLQKVSISTSLTYLQLCC